MSSAPAVSIKDLRIALPPGGERAYAVDGVSFDLAPGEIVCVVGESGSGKSMCAHALMGLLPDSVTTETGVIAFEGNNLLALDADGWRDLRGRRIAMVFQEPMTALNPLMRIGEQMMEMFEAHGLLSPRERRQKALDLAREVGLPDPARIVRAYPHQLSGGQRQRAMIAMALALEPAVLVADEPTTALDVTTQAQILKLIRDLQRGRNMAVMFITHDFGVVADIADRVVVLRHGQIVEQGSAQAVLGRPQHAYTRALLAAVPSMTPPPRTPLIDRHKAVDVIGIDKTYVTSGGWFRQDRTVQAASEVSFSILKGETLDPKPIFNTTERCQSLGVWVEANRNYLVQFGKTADAKPETDSFRFASIDASHGFRSTETGSLLMDPLMIAAMPLRRDWFRPWFEVVVRIGGRGGEEAFIDADPKDQWVIDSPFTATRDGELFIFVNAPVIGIPGLYDYFYRFNQGQATVTLKRIN